MNTVAVLTDPQCGGTFLCWSLHWLAGHDRYYSTRARSWLEVCNDPLTQTNSHKFLANQFNHINTIQELDSQIQNLTSQATDQFHTFYFHNFKNSSLDQPAVDHVQSLPSKILYVSSTHWPLYYAASTPRAAKTAQDTVEDTIIEQFFSESYKNWQQHNLTEIWDKREFIALNFRPLQAPTALPRPQQAFVIDAMDLWTCLDLTIQQIFDYLGLDLLVNRQQHWNSVYQRWKRINYHRLQFIFYFDKIIYSIVNNLNFDLTRFNLDLYQEAALQHALIYRHNLNFKTWNLTKFCNAQQLHALLEPNHHSLT